MGLESVMIDCTTQSLAGKDPTEEGEAPSTGMMSVLAKQSCISPPRPV